MEFYVQREVFEFEEPGIPEGFVFDPEDGNEGPSGDDFEALLDSVCGLCLEEAGPVYSWESLQQVPKGELVVPFFYLITSEGPKMGEMHMCRGHAARNGNDYRVPVLRDTVTIDIFATLTALPLITTLN
jgi:hypothetical protein